MIFNTNVSAEEATAQVNKLVDESKQLNAMKTGIDSISSVYQEKRVAAVTGYDTANEKSDFKLIAFT